MLSRFIQWLAVAGLAIAATPAFASSEAGAAQAETLLVEAGRLFDGRRVVDNARIVIRDGVVVQVGPRAAVAIPDGARVVDRSDRFVMPGLISTHSHVGMISGVEHGGRNYTRETVVRDLAQYQRFGIVAINTPGFNRPIFHELRREFNGADHGGADLYGAQGIGAIDGSPPAAMMNLVPDQTARPASAEEARQAVRGMAAGGVDMVKVWIDNMRGTVDLLPGDIFRAVVDEARQHGLNVAAHVHDLEEARTAVQGGAFMVAHSIRDTEVDQPFIDLMLERGAWYVPTVHLTESGFYYADHPEVVDDAFLRRGLSPELEAQLRDPEWRRTALENAGQAREALRYNFVNLRRLADAGVKIALGTDSGAVALNVPGFAEHRELELMVEAGLSPVQALTAGTANSAELIGLADRGTLEPGRRADFLVLERDPTADIRATRSLLEVWRSGRQAH